MTPLTDEQRAMVEQHADLPIVLADMLIRKVFQYHHAIDRDELVSAGSLALVIAAQRFNPSKGASFRTYAGHRVKSAMMEHQRTQRRSGGWSRYTGQRVTLAPAIEGLTVPDPTPDPFRRARLAEFWRWAAGLNSKRLRALQMTADGYLQSEIGSAVGLTSSTVCTLIKTTLAQWQTYAACLFVLIATSAHAQPFYGPQPTITCPAGAVDIWPGMSIQLAVNSNVGGTTFCIHAGTYQITASITPKSGDTFVGEYGAILDGSGWTTADDTQAAFRSHLQDIDRVTIRNLRILHMPQRGIHAFYQFSDSWTIENNEIAYNKAGVSLPNSSVLRWNVIHHNTGDSKGGLIPNGGYIVTLAHDVLIEQNEISYNGDIQKIVDGTQNVTFRANYVHHNLGSGIWYDGDNTGILVENNLVEDNGYHGIIIEISGQSVLRYNTIRRSGDSGIFLSTSQNADVYQNTLENNFRSINLFVNCPSVGGGSLVWDLKNNRVHDNTITVGTQAGVLANALSGSGTCTSSYTSGTLKGNSFATNHYTVPDVFAAIWYWQGGTTWQQWQALQQDVTGTLNAPVTPTPTTEPPPPPPPVLDTLAPTVTIKTPTRSGKSTNYSVTATATDNVGVTWFALSIDKQVFANQPGSYSVKIATAGVHTFKAEAKDAAGNYASTTATVTR